MKTLIIIALTTITAVANTTVNFDNAAAGQLPAGWTSTKTGDGKPKWTVEKEETAPSQPHVLKQSGQADYPLAVKDDTRLKDGFVEVKFKPLTGKKDQAAGVVWRYQDAGNYYIARANALEGNVVLYKVEQGKRKSLDIVGRKGGYGVEAPVPANTWSTLRVEFSGTRHTVHLNGKELFAVDNDLFTAPGKVGVWTKADSVTLFDEFSYGAK